VFKLTSAGQLTVLYNFCSLASCTDGANPYGGLVQASDGNFYGTTSAGGTPLRRVLINQTALLQKLFHYGGRVEMLSVDGIIQSPHILVGDQAG